MGGFGLDVVTNQFLPHHPVEQPYKEGGLSVCLSRKVAHANCFPAAATPNKKCGRFISRTFVVIARFAVLL